MFRELDPKRIVETADTLERRIAERFPGAGLARVAAELAQVTREADAVSAWLAKPIHALRAAVALLVLALLTVVTIALSLIRVDFHGEGFSELAQGVAASVDNCVFVGIAIYFLLGIERRIKRARASKALHVLRSLAHIVDMHQLTKDPERLVGANQATASSPKRDMSPFQLTRYLDYCSEMLALISKVAALYVQRFDDEAALSAAGDVEDLTVGLSRNIWQKIMILDRMTEPGAAEPIG